MKRLARGLHDMLLMPSVGPSTCTSPLGLCRGRAAGAAAPNMLPPALLALQLRAPLAAAGRCYPGATVRPRGMGMDSRVNPPSRGGCGMVRGKRVPLHVHGARCWVPALPSAPPHLMLRQLHEWTAPARPQKRTGRPEEVVARAGVDRRAAIWLAQTALTGSVHCK